MSSLKKLDLIKNEFNNNINSIEEENFKHTKGLLSNFGDYIEKNKVFLYGLAGLALFSAVNKSVVEVKNYLQDESSYSHQINEINDNGLTIYKEIKEFNQKSNDHHSTININYKNNLQEINFNEINDLYENQSPTLEIKNPFWNNNTFKLEINNESFSHFLSKVWGDERLDLVDNDSLLLVDRSDNTIILNVKDIEKIAEINEMSDVSLFKKFVLYHEAAHGSKDQIYYNGEAMNSIDREIHSDLSALMMIGVESKDLKTFNQAANDVIKFRATSIEIGDSNHNTLYSLIELKNLVNNNPELLNLKKDDIVEFSFQLKEQISQNDFSNMLRDKLSESGFDYSKEGILNDIKSGNNIELMDIVAKDILWGNKKISDVKSEFTEERLEKLADRIESGMFKATNQAKLTEMIYHSNGMNKKELIKDLEIAVNENSAINQNFVKMIQSKIKIDELELNFSSLNDLRLQEMAENSHGHVVRNNTFKYN